MKKSVEIRVIRPPFGLQIRMGGDSKKTGVAVQPYKNYKFNAVLDFRHY
jgi:hypothetical protein